VAESLWHVGDHWYVETVNEAYGVPREQGPFLCRLVWAGSDGAAAALVRRDRNLDDGAVVSQLPSGRFPGLKSGRYRDVLDYFKLGPMNFAERAAYRLDGSFDRKIIGTRLGEFCYRDLVITDDEPLWAISISFATPEQGRN
jgi:hypothetical protein